MRRLSILHPNKRV